MAQDKAKSPGCVSMIVAVVGIIVLLAWISGGGDRESRDSGAGSSSDQSGPSASDIRFGAQVQAENIVEAFLRAPSTADFSWSPAVGYDAARKLVSVSGYVDAQNGFGAMIRNDYHLTFRLACQDVYRGSCWEVLQLAIANEVLVDKPLPGADTATGSAGSSSNSSGTSLTPDEVRELQEALNATGFDAGAVDGIYGPATAEALRRFRLELGLDRSRPVDRDALDAVRAWRNAVESDAAN